MASNKDLNRLKVILAEKKSNLWLSRQLGCAPTTVSKWCTNSLQPPLESLMKITRLLDVEFKDLVRYEELDKNEEKVDSQAETGVDSKHSEF
ncbi:MAG: XRE family transcriptional regulator [Prevotella sp.]|nr:helix-turn-helix transcriptional regulator [uncultured Prevotella sp.]MBD9261933.1 XRE family transcriptional regulator [Prevotella sp.]